MGTQERTRRVNAFEKNSSSNSYLQKFNQNPSCLACTIFIQQSCICIIQFEWKLKLHWLFWNLVEFDSLCAASSIILCLNSVHTLSSIEGRTFVPQKDHEFSRKLQISHWPGPNRIGSYKYFPGRVQTRFLGPGEVLHLQFLLTLYRCQLWNFDFTLKGAMAGEIFFHFHLFQLYYLLKNLNSPSLN